MKSLVDDAILSTSSFPGIFLDAKRGRPDRRTDTRGRALRTRRGFIGPLRGVRPPLPHSRGPRGGLPCAVQQDRAAHGAMGLRRRGAMRSHRKEAVLPRLARQPGLQLRDARLRFPLRLLPELVQLAGAAGSRIGGRCGAGGARASDRSGDPIGRARRGQHLQRTADYGRVGHGDFRQAKAAGLATGMVSNGHGTPEVVEFLRPWLDLFKVDLKSMDDRAYRRLGGRLEPVLDTIRRMHALDVWVEVVTLLVPGFNDASDELERLAGFIASVSPDIPWHVTAFHPDYHMTGVRATSPDDLLRACDLGRRAGVRFVYPGNLPGRVNQLENTSCPDCDRTLVERVGYRVTRVAVTPEGTCKACGAPIPGRWS